MDENEGEHAGSHRQSDEGEHASSHRQSVNPSSFVEAVPALIIRVLQEPQYLKEKL
jgi:hypothetical protein